MHRHARRPLGVPAIIALLLIVTFGCGQNVVTPSPSAGPTVAPSPAVTSSPSTAPTDLPPGTARWSLGTPAGPVPDAREAATWTVDPSGAVAYLFGGRGAGGDLDDLFAYDLAADRWIRLAPIGPTPPPRSGHVAAWIDGLGLVVYGGRSGSSALADLWAYDPEANGWRTLTTTGDAPGARAGSCGAVALDGRLWISHGEAAVGTYLDDTWVYAPGQSVWTRIETAARPSARAGAACWWTDDDRLTLLGGRTAATAASGDLWTLTLDTDGWQEIPSPAGSARADAGGGRTAGAGIAVDGTSPDGLLLADLVVLDMTSLAGSVVPSAGDAPTPRSGAVVVDDPAGERMLLFAGRDASGVQADVWTLDLP
jgi:hypothetical protein